MEERIRKLLIEEPDKGMELAMRQYGGLCWSVARAHLDGIGTREDIEDCVSEGFAALYGAREKLDGQKGTVKSYLAVIVKRRAIDQYHRLMKKQAEEERIAAETDKELAESEEVRVIDRESLLGALKELGEPDTQIFVRKYFLGQSTKEIAAVLGLKANTVDKKVQRGLEKLRMLLEGGQQL